MKSTEKMVVEIDDLCTMLGVGKNTAYSLLTSGEIDAFKIGAVWKIPVKSIENYIDNKCNQYKTMCKLIN
jgi:excisionase family DNA binding protein